jgi:hypothetical protein
MQKLGQRSLPTLFSFFGNNQAEHFCSEPIRQHEPPGCLGRKTTWGQVADTFDGVALSTTPGPIA